MTLLTLLFLTSTAMANPENKLCRAAQGAKTNFSDYIRETSASEISLNNSGVCFHVGRIVGGIEEGMSFRDRNKPRAPLLALADEMRDRAASLKGFCGGAPIDGRNEKGVREADRAELDRQLEKMLGVSGTNERITAASCENLR